MDAIDCWTFFNSLRSRARVLSSSACSSSIVARSAGSGTSTVSRRCSVVSPAFFSKSFSSCCKRARKKASCASFIYSLSLIFRICSSVSRAPPVAVSGIGLDVFVATSLTFETSGFSILSVDLTEVLLPLIDAPDRIWSTIVFSALVLAFAAGNAFLTGAALAMAVGLWRLAILLGKAVSFAVFTVFLGAAVFTALAIDLAEDLEACYPGPAFDLSELAIFLPKLTFLTAALTLAVTVDFLAACFLEAAVTIAFICLYPHELLVRTHVRRLCSVAFCFLALAQRLLPLKNFKNPP